MGFFSVLKTLAITAIISLILYLVMSYVLVPVWKRYRDRYNSYLPLSAISSQTNSLRQRTQEALIENFVPTTWRSRLHGRYQASADDGSDFDEDDGEELYEVENNRREEISLAAQSGRIENRRRLSRDLEEGFKDDSDSDSGNYNYLQQQTRVGIR
ncbi:BgTH12-01915 [Blumeria graminis f. sp. triticale]|nr:BgTH12-01915 [Blumeria graminis f. sp. triticale]